MGQAPTTSSQPGTIAPADLLAQIGPCVQVTLSVAQTMAAQLVQQGIPLPAPESGLAVLDTGASVTCIDDAAARRLGLPVVNVVQMGSASHPSTPQNIYPCQIQVAGLPLPFTALAAMGATLAPLGYIALIGRDLLRYCTLFYNGISGEFTLSI